MLVRNIGMFFTGILLSFFLCLLCLLLSFPAKGLEYENLQNLQVQVKRALLDSILENNPRYQRVTVQLSPIDPRLKLVKCDRPLSYEQPTELRANTSIKVLCSGLQPWSIFISARIKAFIQLPVLVHNLGRGEVITEQDLSLSEQDALKQGIGVITQVERLIGKELRRALKAGSTIRRSQISQPLMVKRGDSVMVNANSGMVTVLVPGEALADGRLGEQIRVKNRDSRKVIKGQVIGPGRVKVVL